MDSVFDLFSTWNKFTERDPACETEMSLRAMYSFSPGKPWKSLPEILSLYNFKPWIKEGMENRNNTKQWQKEELF